MHDVQEGFSDVLLESDPASSLLWVVMLHLGSQLGSRISGYWLLVHSVYCVHLVPSPGGSVYSKVPIAICLSL